jgi:hypothetical protein
MRTAKRYGHIRPEAQRQALDRVATVEIYKPVNQIVNRILDAVQCQLLN